MHTEQLEGLAVQILRKTRAKQPVNALLLADALGLELVPVAGPHDEGRCGIEIRFNALARYRDRQEYIAGCVARWAILDSGHYATEVACRRLARALMLPREAFIADLARNRDLAWLQQRHVHASPTMIAARCSDVGARLSAVKRASFSQPAAALVSARVLPASTAASLPPPAADSQLPETL